MAYEYLILERHEHLATVLLNRPKVYNALSQPLMRELVTVLTELDADADVRAIILRGTGEHFAAGADIKELAALTTAELIRHDTALAWEQVAAIQTPLIAAVDGYCLGAGAELALACDIIIATDKAVFGFPEVTLGILPGAGGTQRLARVVGRNAALELILTGARIDAARAQQMGWVNHVVPRTTFDETVTQVASAIAANAPLAVRLAKRALVLGLEMALPAAIDYEHKLFALLFNTEDRAEGLHAFLEKRKPVFTGR